jgi:ATP-dependent protease HslVU (ClpYQ) peptidase subunit
MTTLVGVQGRNWALLGADTRIADDSRIYKLPKGHSKIIEQENFTIACAGDVRAINILQSQLKLPKTYVPKDDAHFMTGFLLPAMRKAFADAGYEKTMEGQSSHESEFLIIYNGKIYEVGSDYSWVQDARGIYGLGSGGAIAIGALACLSGDTVTRTEARKWATKALEIASEYNSDTAAPFHIVIKDLT